MQRLSCDEGVVITQKSSIDFTKLRRLGIDEIALLKGGKNSIVILVDLDTGKPIAFAPDRQQRDIRAVLESWGTQVLNQICEVSMDLCSNYKGLVTKVLPNADITVDRFHVMFLMNEELDRARRTVQKSAEKLADKTEKEKVKSLRSNSKKVIPGLGFSGLRSLTLSRIDLSFSELISKCNCFGFGIQYVRQYYSLIIIAF